MKRRTLLLTLLCCSLNCLAVFEHEPPHLLNGEIQYFDTFRQSMQELGFHYKNATSKLYFMTGDMGKSHCYIRIMREDSIHAIEARIQLFGESSDSIYLVLFNEMRTQFASEKHVKKTSGDTIYDYWLESHNDRVYAMAELYRVKEKTGKLGLHSKTTLVSCKVTNMDLYQRLSGKKYSAPNKPKKRNRLAIIIGIILGLLLPSRSALLRSKN